MLSKLLHMIRFRRMKWRSTERPVAFLTNTLLAEYKYAAWFDALIRQGEAELAMVGSAASQAKVTPRSPVCRVQG